MLEGIKFVYDGVKSDDMGLYNVRIDSGLFDEPFVSERTIQKITVRGRDKPYLQGIEKSPLIFSLTFAFQDIYDEKRIREVARWLAQDYYKEFYTEDNPDRIFRCMLISSSRLLHNGLKQGYVTLEMECDSPYSYSPVYTSSKYTITDSGVIEFVNSGDLPCNPDIFITKVGNGDLSIINTTNKGIEFKFTSLIDGENLYIDCDSQYIETDLPNTYRYSNFNDNYLEIVRGKNILNVNGNCILQFRYEFRTMQG